MSQRLLISCESLVNSKKDLFYDAIYNESGSLSVLLNDWIHYENGVYLGPWKIVIRSPELMDQFIGDFNLLGKKLERPLSFSDVWCILDGEGNILHISESEDEEYASIIKKVLGGVS